MQRRRPGGAQLPAGHQSGVQRCLMQSEAVLLPMQGPVEQRLPSALKSCLQMQAPLQQHCLRLHMCLQPYLGQQRPEVGQMLAQ